MAPADTAPEESVTTLLLAARAERRSASSAGERYCLLNQIEIPVTDTHLVTRIS